MRVARTIANLGRTVTLPLGRIPKSVLPLYPLKPKSPVAIAREKDRDLVLAVLKTTATKREARQFVARYANKNTNNDISNCRVAVIRVPAELPHQSPSEAKALGQTLAQLSLLGARPVVVLDASEAANRVLQHGTARYAAERTAVSLAATQWSTLIGSNAVPLSSPFEWTVSNKSHEDLVLDAVPVLRLVQGGSVPVLCPTAYDPESAETTFCGPDAVPAIISALQGNSAIVDKVVFVDSVGGIPSARRKFAAHLFINLLQEYGEVSSVLRSPTSETKNADRHIANLDTMQTVLSSLPPTATGIITSPRAAAASTSSLEMHKNPILYNLLTDRPLCSPSLPLELAQTRLETTVLRRGMPVRIVRPANSFSMSAAAKAGELSIPKLEHLINESFGKKIDMEHYLGRIGNKTAAVIIVGDYEGAAIITWETAPSGRQIAYLDKLAVHPAAQGAAGVADVMLILMIRRLFSKEIVWRSRAANPVNKWYFERSRGFLRVPDTQWVMFWNTSSDSPPLDEYVAVCADIEPSFGRQK